MSWPVRLSPQSHFRACFGPLSARCSSASARARLRDLRPAPLQPQSQMATAKLPRSTTRTGASATAASAASSRPRGMAGPVLLALAMALVALMVMLAHSAGPPRLSVGGLGPGTGPVRTLGDECRRLAGRVGRPRGVRADMNDITLVEVSARDGLQNDPGRLTTEQKVELISRCAAAGLRRAEVASFVNPRLVPQMADAEAVVAGVRSSITGPASWIGLVLNTRGFHRAAATGVDEVNCVVGVSDEFSHANQGMSTDEAIAVVAEVAPLAQAAGIVPTVTLSVAFGCPFSGEVPVRRLLDVASRVATTGVVEVAIADTIGVAVPRDVDRARRGHACRDRRPAAARALPQHPQHRLRQRPGSGRGRGDRAGRQPRRDRRLPVRPARHRQHRDRGPRLRAAPHRAIAQGSTWTPRSRPADGCPQQLDRTLPAYLPRAGVFPARVG